VCVCVCVCDKSCSIALSLRRNAPTCSHAKYVWFSCYYYCNTVVKHCLSHFFLCDLYLVANNLCLVMFNDIATTGFKNICLVVVLFLLFAL
jgi:hypothetical protein